MLALCNHRCKMQIVFSISIIILLVNRVNIKKKEVIEGWKNM
jgi:hypothetical protein